MTLILNSFCKFVIRTMFTGVRYHEMLFMRAMKPKECSLKPHTNTCTHTCTHTHIHTHTHTCYTNRAISSLNRSIIVKRSQQLSQYHYVSGQVIEVDGLKGEFYIKVRLNIHPMHQRQQKFSRGPVIHKTRTLRLRTILFFLTP